MKETLFSKRTMSDTVLARLKIEGGSTSSVLNLFEKSEVDASAELEGRRRTRNWASSLLSR